MTEEFRINAKLCKSDIEQSLNDIINRYKEFKGVFEYALKRADSEAFNFLSDNITK